MSKNKFPALIHMVWEEYENDDPYLAYHSDGVLGAEKANTPIAVYKLVSVGRVEITKRLVANKKARR